MPWNSGVLDTAYVRLSRTDLTIVYCGSGYRSALASAFLGSKGFKQIHNMVGGFNNWHYSVEVGGHVSTSTTWKKEKSPYLAIGDVTTDSAVTLTTQAGVSIKFRDSHAFRIHGIWVAQGTAYDPVTITRGDSAGHFPIEILGTIDAQHVNFEYFDASGVNIEPTATVEKLNYISFLNDDIPGPNDFLQLTPTDDTSRLLIFNGGAPGEDCNINLGGDGTLTVYGDGGDFGGPDYDCPGDGEIIWLQVIRGDANGDWSIDPGDVIYLLNYLFRDGPAPNPLEAGDCNSDGTVGPGDVVYLLNYLFRNGPPPCRL
jgi:hypothetical protein